MLRRAADVSRVNTIRAAGCLAHVLGHTPQLGGDSRFDVSHLQLGPRVSRVCGLQRQLRAHGCLDIGHVGRLDTVGEECRWRPAEWCSRSWPGNARVTVASVAQAIRYWMTS
jgi:hypothetical protein